MSQTVNDRIKLLRETLGLSLRAFGKEVGYTNPTISLIERGLKNPEDRMLRLICSAFDVNETWLRTGKGEMFLTDKGPNKSDILTEFLASVLNELSEDNRKIVLEAIHKLKDQNFFS